MKIIKGLPNITVKSSPSHNFEINTLQYLEEQDDRVYLRCAEYIPLFKRGFTCDLVLEYCVQDTDSTNGEKDKNYDYIQDLVLVYVNKEFDLESLTRYEYVFYK